ncbi:MAG TPA: PTS sugar transporter subunit IIA [Urbifossiella sp.]|jgi:mannitol/fructose-specific phosphotransferase system IIA component (Ntr-type)|nr:PTS sugar transporter subunit IIA [Urbifossiella sp.]
MRLTNFIVRDAIIPALKTTAADINPHDPAAVGLIKERVIREMVDSLAAAGGFPDGDLEDITKAVLRRELLGTTGIGKNIAIPHSRHPSVNKLVGALALSPGGLPFESLDGEQVYVLVLLISPQERPGDHLRALEAVVRTMRNDDYVKQLRACTTKDEIWNLLENAPGW